MIYAGVDPGRNGGIAFIYKDGTTEVYSMREVDIVALFRERQSAPIRLCLEKVHSMPKQGVASTFNFGVNYGYLKGVLDACRVSYQEVPPQKWKAEFGLNTDKKKSIEVCKQLFPEANLRPTEQCRTDNDGMAESLLMAEYARRKL